eukprot:gene9312-9393_t
MQTFLRGASNWGRAALDLLLPPNCLTCDAPTDATGRFCAGCFGKIQFITAPFCRRCALPFAHAAEAAASGICVSCTAYPPLWSQARAALRYDAQSRRLILPLKHGDRVELAASLARMMTRAGADLLEEADLLVPVPLHPSRLRSRRYNQSALLAREIARLSKVPARLDALVRLRMTQPLGDLSAEQRSRMVAHAFAPRRGAGASLKGRHILLIDDVMTSGATCTACTSALLASGAARVDVLTAARVPDPRQEEERHLAARPPGDATAMIDIYTQDFCPYCTRAKSLLTQKGVAFNEIYAPNGSKERAESLQRTGRTSVPQIFINGNHVGGCDDLMALDRAGKLDSLLTAA